jgi:hypothetical protein
VASKLSLSFLAIAIPPTSIGEEKIDLIFFTRFLPALIFSSSDMDIKTTSGFIS